MDNQSIAKETLSLLEKYRISPSPENYGIWFHYTTGKNLELKREIDAILSSNIEFTEQTTQYLYNKYVLSHADKTKVDDVANDTQKVLQAVQHLVNEFSGEAKSYNKEIDHALTDISKNLDEGNVRSIVKSLVDATKSLKERGEQMHKKIEESTQEITSLRKNLEQVTNESQRDFLTGTYNRKTFEKYFADYEQQAKEKTEELCLIIIDIDHFKLFNDKFGHLIGDEVLKIVARSLIDSLKGRDIVARFGGEEFVVLLPETPLDVAVRVADMVRTTISTKELKRRDTGENYGKITVSMGVSRYRHLSDTLPTLIKRADDALYKSKHDGRNRVTKEA